MSLPDIQLHLSRSFCWHAGLCYGTRSSPQMKANNMNLTLPTTNSNFGDEAMGCGGGVKLLLPALLAYLQTIPRVTNPSNLTDPKLVGYKVMRGSRNFFRGGGPCPTARNGQRILFFFCPQLILQFIEGVPWFYYRENYTFPRIQRGSDISQGGGSNFFQGGEGVIIIIFKETYITCDFLGGPDPKSPPSESAHAKLQFWSVLSHVILERRPSPVRVSPYSH